MVRTSWIYNVKKEELIGYLDEFGLDTTGTVDDLRRRLSTFVTEAGGDYKQRLAELEAKHLREPSPARIEMKPGASKTTISSVNNLDVPDYSSVLRKAETSSTNVTNATAMTTGLSTTASTYTSERDNSVPQANAQQRDYAPIMNKVRKWSVRFNGESEPLTFIDRVEELADVYDIPLDFLPRTMLEFLSDKALRWYRNNNLHWQTWKAHKQDFLEFFLPTRYFEHLKDTIRERHQQANETFKDYSVAMLDLMRRTNYNDEKKLDRIFRNSRHEYQFHIK